MEKMKSYYDASRSGAKKSTGRKFSSEKGGGREAGLRFRLFIDSPSRLENPDYVFPMVARTLMNFEPLLESELKALGASFVKTEKRAVTFKGSLRTLYRANYELRTAVSVLIPIAEFPAFTDTDLYKNAGKIPWEEWIRPEYTFAISSDVSSRTITHSQFASQRLKDAIADRFREKTGSRPSVDLEKPDVRIRLLIGNNKGTVYLDTSGDPLSHRGYRTQSGEAPLSEVLAAGMLLMAGFSGNETLLDPMCGSGTLPIEAAYIAGNIPAAYVREDFGFFRIPHFNRKVWDSVKNTAMKNIRFRRKTDKDDLLPHPIERKADSRLLIQGSDSDSGILKIAKNNAERAMVSDLIRWKNEDFFDLEPPPAEEPGKAIGICNPPYGERMVLQDPDAFYDSMGDRLKNYWLNYDFWIITSDREALKKMGLRGDKKTDLMNAAIECRFQRYQIYKGSREG